MGTPNVINVIEKFNGHTPIIKINNPSDSIGVIIEGPRDSIYFQIDTVPENYFKDRQDELVKTTLPAATANDRWNIMDISKPLD